MAMKNMALIALTKSINELRLISANQLHLRIITFKN